jgi:hypothetical protein
MMKIQPKLVVAVQVRKGKLAKCPWVSCVTVSIENVAQVAIGTVGGRCTEADALREFRRNPGRFKKLPGYEFASVLGLVPAAKLAA